ncbi:MAG: Zeta toxin family protein, partial [Armatimonadetes bacterium]|nr:Zeta toxin family protein [Armatimonadota bacterium]
MSDRPRLYVIAGPNGAGKTTFAMEYLPRWAQCFEFVNADLIATGISPFRPESAAVGAGRALVHRIRELIARGDDLAVETTLAAKGIARTIRE